MNPDRHTAAVLAAVTLSAVAALAQPADPAKEVLKTEELWTQALVKKDVAALRGLYADELVYVHSGGNIDTKSEFLARVEKGSLIYHKVELLQPKVRVYGDAAVVNGAFNVSVDVDGAPVNTKVVYLHVYARQGARWRLVAHQTTRAPEK